MFENYKNQVALLVKILPLVSKERCFALHGGTAINLFMLDMPRLSVDIDLTYVPIGDRQTALTDIKGTLERIKSDIETNYPDIHVEHKEETAKLFVAQGQTKIKLEVNKTARGIVSDVQTVNLSKKAQDEFESFVAMQVVPFGQLYGGKICAALDRQHPRDLFDVKLLLENEGFSQEVKEGFLLCLLSSDRPLHELISPNMLNQTETIKKQFSGMTDIPFSYEDFEQTRDKLVKIILVELTDKDKEFLLSIHNCEPDWNIYNFENFPAVKWKMQHLQILKNDNPEKHKNQYDALVEKLK